MSKPHQPLRLVILISGQGSNLQAFIDAIVQGQLPATIAAVISHRANAYGLQRAAQAGIANHCLLPADFATSAAYEQALSQLINQYQPDLVILAGYMRILGANFVAQFEGKLLNIHPSLLPNYPGLHTHERVLAAGEAEHGTTVHFVNAVLDGGPVVAQARLPIQADDTPDSLKARVQQLEYQLYPLVVYWFATGRLALTPAGVRLDQQLLPKQGCQFQADELSVAWRQVWSDLNS